jgi:hypothetical protein
VFFPTKQSAYDALETKGWHHIVKDTMRPLTSKFVVKSAYRAQTFVHFPYIRLSSLFITRQFAMKRSATAASLKAGTQSPKKPRTSKPSISVPEYHSTPSRKDSTGEIIWPAPKSQIEVARDFIREWYVISSLPMPNIWEDRMSPGRKSLEADDLIVSRPPNLLLLSPTKTLTA